METGIMKDYGAFLGELAGYVVVEGTEVEVETMVNQYVPFVSFISHPILSLSQVEQMLKSLAEKVK